MRATGKEDNWHGASITPCGILLGPTHTYLGRDLTHSPSSASSSASCMRHAPASKRHQQLPENGVLLRRRTLPSAKKKHFGWYSKLSVSTASEIRLHICEQVGNCEHRKRWKPTHDENPKTKYIGFLSVLCSIRTVSWTHDAFMHKEK